MYSPNFTVDNKIFCLSMHHNGDTDYVEMFMILVLIIVPLQMMKY